jgi:pimeloyl-ACP methyl ester carboxylesterase
MRTCKKLLTTAVVALIALSGAAGCSGMKNGSLTKVAPTTTTQRVGSVYLLRGWIGIFSTGIDSLGKKINDRGIHAEVFQEAQWAILADNIIEQYRANPQHEPIIIIGHSYGADDAIAISRKLNDANIRVELVVTLDPVTPRKVPANINTVYNLYQSNGAMDALPWLRGIPLTADEPGPRVLKNMNIRTERTDLMYANLDHFNIEKKEKIHDDVLAQVMRVCEPRAAWAARRAPAQLASIKVSEPESGKGDAEPRTTLISVPK